jgi:O-antigen ligase
MGGTTLLLNRHLPAGSLLMLWFAYLLLAPTLGFNWIDSWHNEQRAVEVALLSATALFGVASYHEALTPRSRTTLLLWAVVALGALSALQATFVAAAFIEISLSLLLAVLAVVTAAAVRCDREWTSIWARRACVLLGAVHVAGIATRYAAMLVLERAPTLDVLLLGFANPRFASALYALLMPMIAVFALDTRERLAFRRIAWAILALLWCVNLALGTRAIWFAYGLALPVATAIIGWRRILPGARVLGSTALAGILAYLLLFVALPTWLALGDALPSHVDHLTSVSDRALLWQQGLTAIRAHPWLGIGPMNLAGQGDSFASHPHDWILQVGAEWGVPALVLLVWILLRLAGDVRQSLNASHGIELDLLGPSAATIVGLCYGLVDGNLVMPVSQTAFALIAGLLCGNVYVTASKTPPRRSFAPLALGAVLASTLFLVGYVVETLPRQDDAERQWRQTSRYSELAPRFWQQGLLLR